MGIDGSKAAVGAAQWAIGEAETREVPLRLIYARGEVRRVDSATEAPADMADPHAAAESALRHAAAVIEAANRPVKVETEIAPGAPVEALLRASAWAAMVCVGAVGRRHFCAGRTGSIGAALAVSAHCPVAIIRDTPPRPPARDIVVELDGAPDNGLLLGAAMEEALLRRAPVRAVICRHTAAGHTADGDGDGRALAALDRRLARWQRQYPQLQVQSVAAPGTLIEYLACCGRQVQLAVVGSHDPAHLSELVGRVGNAALHGADCSLLIVNRRHL
ncbi:hypothetical protein X011_13270 [Mycobacterium tuberculosis variant microti OV254]|nr:hypothetical protein X011_13270 [Mycobacterium tuberculosis variant microti OV254]